MNLEGKLLPLSLEVPKAIAHPSVWAVTEAIWSHTDKIAMFRDLKEGHEKYA